MSYYSHLYIKPGRVQARQYQIELANLSAVENILIVLPTGLGKTVVAILVVAEYLNRHPEKSCLILAPTKVLAHQHYALFRDSLSLDGDHMAVVTGEVPLERRLEGWSKRIVFATPQIAVNDLERGLADPSRISIVVFDEAHRAVGEYAYTLFWRKLVAAGSSARSLGLTASLHSEQAKVEEVMRNIGLSRIELRDERSMDVRKYVYETDVEWVELILPSTILRIRELLNEALVERLGMLEEAGLTRAASGARSFKILLELRGKLGRNTPPQARGALFSAIRLSYAIGLVETETLSTMTNFLERTFRRTRGFGVKGLLNDQRVKEAYEIAKAAVGIGIEHPKLQAVREILKSVKEGERALVFASYRDTVEAVCRDLTGANLCVETLVGRSGVRGQSQAEQVRKLEDFKSGKFNILVATQVGEEGLDIIECNRVVFYDNVPSAIRFIQRRGRTGRRAPGKVFILVAKDTRDEAFYWMGRRRLSEMKRVVEQVRGERKATLDQFLSSTSNAASPLIYMDAREAPQLASKLTEQGATVEVKALTVGDFVASEDVVIERKLVEDFVRSVQDGRLFQQIKAMEDNYSKPLLIIQGDWRSATGLSESAFLGALVSVLTGFRTSIINTGSDEDTAKLIYSISRYEQQEQKRGARLREGRRPVGLDETQRYVIGGVLGISSVLADNLLRRLGSVERIFSANEDELMRVEGIGEKLAKRIREIATAKYETS